MARRKPTRPTSRSNRGVAPPTARDNPWPNLQELIDSDGSISVGRIPWQSYVAAVANDEHTCYAMLVRRDNESLVDLMTRLDLALATAIETETCIDEINPR